MWDYDDFKKQYTLEDTYKILCEHKPHHRSRLYEDWNDIESSIYEELMSENENPKLCENLMEDTVMFLNKKIIFNIEKMENIRRRENAKNNGNI